MCQKSWITLRDPHRYMVVVEGKKVVVQKRHKSCSPSKRAMTQRLSFALRCLHLLRSHNTAHEQMLQPRYLMELYDLCVIRVSVSDILCLQIWSWTSLEPWAKISHGGAVCCCCCYCYLFVFLVSHCCSVHRLLLLTLIYRQFHLFMLCVCGTVCIVHVQRSQLTA